MKATQPSYGPAHLSSKATAEPRASAEESSTGDSETVHVNVARVARTIAETLREIKERMAPLEELTAMVKFDELQQSLGVLTHRVISEDGSIIFATPNWSQPGSAGGNSADAIAAEREASRSRDEQVRDSYKVWHPTDYRDLKTPYGPKLKYVVHLRPEASVLHPLMGDMARYFEDTSPAVPHRSTLQQRKIRITSSSQSEITDQDEALQQLINTTEVHRPDPQRMQLRKNAVEAVLSNTEWLSAIQVSDNINPDAKNKHAIASRLVKDKRVYALPRGTENLFAAYQFEPTGAPLEVIRQILAVLDGYSNFRIAAWFESTNSFLDGARPRELLETRSADVLKAAKAHVLGPMHG